jgi:hypothetical protein
VIRGLVVLVIALVWALAAFNGIRSGRFTHGRFPWGDLYRVDHPFVFWGVAALLAGLAGAFAFIAGFLLSHPEFEPYLVWPSLFRCRG